MGIAVGVCFSHACRRSRPSGGELQASPVVPDNFGVGLVQKSLSDACLSLLQVKTLAGVGQADESGSNAEGHAQSLPLSISLAVVYQCCVKPKSMVTPCDGMQRTILF